VNVATYQAPLLEPGSSDAFDSIRDAVRACEAQHVEMLCCPEAILGGLADYARDPGAHAIDTGVLAAALALLASETVTTIVGFTERAANGPLYNAAAVLHRGSIAGIYRKRHPAINRSVYAAGTESPVFTIDNLTFGIIICNDSNHPELVGAIAARGARVLFVPSNNGLPPEKSYPALVADTRRLDQSLAIEHRMWVVRADVAGSIPGLVSDGSSAVVGPDGRIVRAAKAGAHDLLIAEITLPEGAPWQTRSPGR
jgi:predicted amidohydrolase